MKYRSDFLSNPSKSSFSLLVEIRDRQGRTYSFRESPDEYHSICVGECSFLMKPEKLLIRHLIQEIQENSDKEFPLKETEAEGCCDRIEHVAVGDRLTLGNSRRVLTYRSHPLECYFLDVRNEEGPLGLLPGDAVRVIGEALRFDCVTVHATASSVTPLSKRRRNAKKALISVTLDAEKKREDQILIVDGVPKLARLLMGLTYDNHSDDFFWDDDDDSEATEAFERALAERKHAFITEVSDNIASIQDIAQITVEREYVAWGEFADMIADNDAALCRAAEKVRRAAGEEKERALDEMLELIRTPDPARSGRSFGRGFTDIRYVWNGDRDALSALADRLCSNLAPEICKGREHTGIDLIRETAEAYAEFELC